MGDNIRLREGEQQLFDMYADPYEQNNLAGKAAHKKQVLEFRAKVLDWWKETGGGPLEVAAHDSHAFSVQATETEPRIEEEFFTGKDLRGWDADDMGFWSVKDGAIVGTAGDQSSFALVGSRRLVKAIRRTWARGGGEHCI